MLRRRETGFTGTPPLVYDTRNQQLGPVAQLGARMTGSHEVEGSNPSRSTIHLKDLNLNFASHGKYHFVPLLSDLTTPSPLRY